MKQVLNKVIAMTVILTAGLYSQATQIDDNLQKVIDLNNVSCLVSVERKNCEAYVHTNDGTTFSRANCSALATYKMLDNSEQKVSVSSEKDSRSGFYEDISRLVVAIPTLGTVYQGTEYIHKKLALSAAKAEIKEILSLIPKCEAQQ